MKLKYILACGLFAGLVSCSEKPSAETNVGATEEVAGGLQGLLLESAPEGAITINELRSSAKAGDAVAFSGKLIGGDPVLIEKRAIMTLGDPAKLISCDLMGEDDHCQTPWDVCCDDSDAIKQNIVTVQAVDASGSPLKESFRGLGGIQELSKVTVLGAVAEESNDENMIVNITGIYVQKD
ncbi:hypothetical protein ACFPK9_08405 [Rubritalea spongiae]|uniref:DUF5666 domain-containing protein n=1 Tax=Rubritalea spongiae TaxID=430797 RepID=A0ABW5E786_9BACT